MKKTKLHLSAGFASTALASTTLRRWCRDLRGWRKACAREEDQCALVAVVRRAQELAKAVQFGICSFQRSRRFHQGAESGLRHFEVYHTARHLRPLDRRWRLSDACPSTKQQARLGIQLILGMMIVSHRGIVLVAGPVRFRRRAPRHLPRPRLRPPHPRRG